MKTAYLTIDDAPGDDFRRKAEFLLSRNIPAVFFCQGDKLIRERENDLLWALGKGFILGNHSWSHADFSRITPEQITIEIERTDSKLKEIYEKAGVPRGRKLFRLPFLNKGGENRAIIQKLLKQRGYGQPDFHNITVTPYDEEEGDADVSCTFDTMDWTVADGSAQFGIRSLQDIFDRMDEDKPFEGRALNYDLTRDIIMMHDDERISGLFTPIIDRLLEKDIVFAAPEIF